MILLILIIAACSLAIIISYVLINRPLGCFFLYAPYINKITRSLYRTLVSIAPVREKTSITF